MSVIGEELGEISGKITSVTITEAGNAVNLEAEVGSVGTMLATVMFGPPVDAAGETGPMTIRGQVFAPDGSSPSFTSGGTWRTSGHHKWENKHISLDSEGQRMLVVDEFDLATRSHKGTIYSLD